MRKKASDFEKEKCYTTRAGKLQHATADCRFLKSRDAIETNRRDAYLSGAKGICVYCWWGT